jgi:predicted RNA-binding protein with PUA-like domain
MQYWLFKSDPEAYGMDDLVRDKKTTWDGVKNPVALRNLRTAKKGDLVFIYHSGEQKAIVGLAEIIKEAYPDPKKKDPKLFVADIQYVKKEKRPVTLAEIKARKEFADWPLVRMPRLSVMQVTDSNWKSLMKMCGE